jgi:hypothetical protein
VRDSIVRLKGRNAYMDTGGAGQGTGLLPDTGPVPSPGIAGYRWLRYRSVLSARRITCLLVAIAV